MTEPQYSATTERLYLRLPEIYRYEDSKQDYQFKKYISSIVDQAGDIEELIDRFKFDDNNSTSDLFDPLTANPEWLTWLGNLFGIPMSDELTTEGKRERISAYTMAPGSKEELQNVAKEVLYGDKFVGIIPHYDEDGPATEWDVLIVTKEEETLSNMLTRDEALGVANKWLVRHYRRNRFPGPVLSDAGWSGAGTLAAGATDGDRLIPGMWYFTLSGIKSVNLNVTVGVVHRVSFWVNPKGGLFTFSMDGESATPQTGTGWRRVSFDVTPTTGTVTAGLNSTAAVADVTAIMVEVATDTRVYFDSSYEESTGLTYQILLNRQYNMCSNPSFEVNTTGWTAVGGTIAQSDDWSAGTGTYSGKYVLTALSGLTNGLSTIITPSRSHYEVKMSLFSYNNVSVMPYYRYRSPAQTAVTYGTRADIPAGTHGFATLSIDMPEDTLELEVGYHIRRYREDGLAPIDGTEVYLDHVLISPSDVLPKYFDGGFEGYQWIGADHESASQTEMPLGVTFVYGYNEFNDDFAGNKPLAYEAVGHGIIDIELDRGFLDTIASTDYSIGARVDSDYDADNIGVPTYLIAKYAVTNEFIASHMLTDEDEYLEGTANQADTDMMPNYLVVDLPPGKKVYFGEVYMRAGPILGFVKETISTSDYIVRAHAKPAGIQLHDKTFITTWDIIEAEILDWNGLDELTFDQLEMLGLTF